MCFPGAAPPPYGPGSLSHSRSWDEQVPIRLIPLERPWCWVPTSARTAAGAVGSRVLLARGDGGFCHLVTSWCWGGAAGWVCLHKLTQKSPRALPFGQPENNFIARFSKLHFLESQTHLQNMLSGRRGAGEKGSCVCMPGVAPCPPPEHPDLWQVGFQPPFDYQEYF